MPPEREIAAHDIPLQYEGKNACSPMLLAFPYDVSQKATLDLQDDAVETVWTFFFFFFQGGGRIFRMTVELPVVF